jgi:hypothetical protein
MRTSRLVALATLLLAALVAVGCGAPGRPRPVRIESNQSFSLGFPSPRTWFSTPEGGEPQGLLLRDGDVVVGDSAVFQYVAGDGPVLNVASDAWSTRLSGKIVTVELESDTAWRWLENGSERELTGLRLVGLPESLDEASLPALKRLAAANPNVGLIAESQETLVQILPLFQPRVFILDDFTADIRRSLANPRKLETMQISASDSGSLDLLPTLPRLRRLVLDDWGVEEAGPLPAGMAGLRSLVIGGADSMMDLSALRAVPAGLEELSLLGMDEPVDLTRLTDLPALRTLILTGTESLTDLSGLASLKKLQWVGVPSNITQRQFAALVAIHPDLKTLEIVDADSVTDLAPLRGLKRLEGLVLDRPFENLEVLHGLKSLRFVGVYADTTRASRDQLASIRKALPDALVVRVKPFSFSGCLGSGWILLLIPVTAAFWFLASRSRKPRVTGARSA